MASMSSGCVMTEDQLCICKYEQVHHERRQMHLWLGVAFKARC